jgi:hypothetical protein
MKEKIITIKPKNISQKQWSSFLLELNLMKKAWKPYGVDMEIKAPGLKNIIKWGTTINNEPKRNRRTSNTVE